MTSIKTNIVSYIYFIVFFFWNTFDPIMSGLYFNSHKILLRYFTALRNVFFYMFVCDGFMI